MKKILSITLCILLFTMMVIPAFSVSAAEENNFFCDDYFLFEIVNGNEIIIHYYLGTEEVVTVPSEINGLPVRSIEKRAFFGTDVKEVIVSEGITTLGEEAFYNCQSLESVTLPSTLESTGTAAFRFCQNLKTVEFEGTDSTPQLGDYLFYACNSLDKVNIPEEVTKIPEGMFAYCQSLDSTVLPQSTKIISDYAFYGSGLSSITLPENLNYIGNMAFAECSTLDEINNLSDRCDVVSENAFSGTPAGNPYEETNGITVYLTINSEWENAYVFGFYGEMGDTATGEPLGEYPGIQMTLAKRTSDGVETYRAQIPADIDYIKFSDGSLLNNRTANISNSELVHNRGFRITEKGEKYWDYDIYEYAITIYFANHLSWTDLEVNYLSPDSDSVSDWRSAPITFFETNSFGQDIYKAEIPQNLEFITLTGYSDTGDFVQTKITTPENRYGYYITQLKTGVSDYDRYIYDPNINPLDPDTVPVYFASTLGWTDIIVYYYQDQITDGELWSRGTPMTYIETNAFGHNIYKADIPHTTTVTFEGYNGTEKVHSSCVAELIGDYNAFFVKNDDLFSLGVYKYSPDVNPLDPDAPAPTSANYISGAKTPVQPVGASSSDKNIVSTTDEISGVITEEGILIEAPFPEVVRYEKGLLASVGAKVNEDANNKIPTVRDDDKGDADGNGVLNVKDATTIQKYLAELITLNDYELKNADVDANFDVNIIDATLIQKFISCLISEFP